MTVNDDTAESGGSGELLSDGIPTDLEAVPEDQIEEIVRSVRVNGPEKELTLAEIVLDVMVAQKEIEDYKRGSLSLFQNLDERQVEAEANGNEKTAAVIEEVKETTLGVYARIQRGDAELHGDRNGPFSDYFETDGIPPGGGVE